MKSISRLLAILLSMIMVVATPFSEVQAAYEAEHDLAEEDSAQAKSQETELFLKTGKTFYEKYIKGKYKGLGKTDIMTLNSVYALEYAINKDLLSDETVSELTGKGGVIDLNTYADTVNIFCARLISAIPEKRCNTNAPDDYPDDITALTQKESDIEWGNKGVMPPDFSVLDMFGQDPAGCSGSTWYLFNYANMSKYALHDGVNNNPEDYWSPYTDSKGNPLLGWIKRSDGKITVQAIYTMSRANLSRFFNTTGYGLVNSDGRFYLIKDDCLVTEPEVINFKNDFTLEGANWYEYGQPEDRDITWIPDKWYGVEEEALEAMIGTQNTEFIYSSETIAFQRLLYIADMGLPIKESNSEAKTDISITLESDSNISLSSLGTSQINVSLAGDGDGWYGKHLQYSSSDDSVAYVDGNGLVYAISEGEADITVTVKSADRISPVRVKVNVTDSPVVTENLKIGYTTEDSLFMSSLISMDDMCQNVLSDDGDIVIMVDQPSFTVNGHFDFNAYDPISAEDELKLYRRTRKNGCGTIAFEEYKRFTDKMHARGKKVYLWLQSWYGNDFGQSVDSNSYWQKMFRTYISDPDNAEASTMVNKLFEAEKGYFARYGSEYDKAGIDGIILDQMGVNPGNYLFHLNDGHIEDLIKSIRLSYSGEIRATYTLTYDTREACLSAKEMMSNVDAVIVNYNELYLQQEFESDSPSLSECKQILREKYADFTDELYEKYPDLSIETQWYIPSVSRPCHTHGYGGKGKLLYLDPNDWSRCGVTTADYYEQMIFWQALLETFGAKPYTTAIYARYIGSEWKCYNRNDNINVGTDVGESVCYKPASKLLKYWSKTSSPSEITPPDPEEEETEDDVLSVSFDDDCIAENESGSYESIYSGQQIKPVIKVTQGRNKYALGRDFTLKYSNNTKADGKTAVVNIKSIGKKFPDQKLEFDIVKKDIGDDDVILGNTVTKNGTVPKPILAYNGMILKSGRDYDLTVKENIITVTGKGNYTGDKTCSVDYVSTEEYKKTKIKVTSGKITKTFNGESQQLNGDDISVQSYSKEPLEEGTGYLVSYSPNINAGKVKAVIVSLGSNSGYASRSYTITPYKTADIIVSMDSDSYPCVKTGVCPKLTLTTSVGGEEVVFTEGYDYKVKFSQNKKPGTGRFTITMLGNYKGARYKGDNSFTITE